MGSEMCIRDSCEIARGRLRNESHAGGPCRHLFIAVLGTSNFYSPFDIGGSCGAFASGGAGKALARGTSTFAWASCLRAIWASEIPLHAVVAAALEALPTVYGRAAWLMRSLPGRREEVRGQTRGIERGGERSMQAVLPSGRLRGKSYMCRRIAINRGIGNGSLLWHALEGVMKGERHGCLVYPEKSACPRT